MLSLICPARFGVPFCSVAHSCRCTHKTNRLCSRWCCFFNWSVFECWSSLVIVDLRQCSTCCIRSGVTRRTHVTVLYLCRMHIPVRVTRGASVAHRYTYAPPCCRTWDVYSLIIVSVKRSCWPCMQWYGTNGCTEQSQCLFIVFPFNVCLLFSLSLVYFYRLVLCGWGILTDSV